MPPAQLRALYDFALQDATTRIDRLEALAAAGDQTALRSGAHALKGSAAMIGATHLRNLAADLETGQMLVEPKTIAQLHKAAAEIRHILDSFSRQTDDL